MLTVNCIHLTLLVVVLYPICIQALRTDQLIDILKLEDQEPAPPPKETQAILLGQLLRRFLEDNFRQIYYELYTINTTLSDIKLLSNITHDVYSIKQGMPHLSAIRETVKEIKTLKDVLENLRRFQDTYMADYKKQSASIIRLVQMGYSTAIRVTELHQVSIKKRSCSDLWKTGDMESGIYSIAPQGEKSNSVDVICDMEIDGGGWTIIQRRGFGNLSKDERPNFSKTWEQYENGFGNISGDYWFGLENIRSLTRNCPHELLINLTDWQGENKFAHYERFHIGSKLGNYRLFVEGHSGTVEDSLLYHNKRQFSTIDKDNDDKWGDINSSCALMYGGGWWYGDCLKSNLNGHYPEDNSQGHVEKLKGIRWNSWTSMKHSLKMTEMKIRPIIDC